MNCLTGRSNSCLRKIKRFIRANELYYFGHNGIASSVSSGSQRAATQFALIALVLSKVIFIFQAIDYKCFMKFIRLRKKFFFRTEFIAKTITGVELWAT